MLGISGDSLETHREFSELNGLEYPLLEDPGAKIRQLYGGGRTTYLVDRDGVVRFIQQGVPDNDELLRELEKL